jgi:hypothetical protein
MLAGRSGDEICRILLFCYIQYIVTCSTEGRRYYATVGESFHGFAHHSVLSRCMVTNSEYASVGCQQTWSNVSMDTLTTWYCRAAW